MNNMIVLDSKQQFALLYKKYVLIVIILKNIISEMKSINTDAGLINFMLSFSGLSSLLIGPKVKIFKLM
jgi:hypothetical protein